MHSLDISFARSFYTPPLHHHNGFEFHYITSGWGGLDSDGVNYQLKEGDFFFNTPGEDHRVIRGQCPQFSQYRGFVYGVEHDEAEMLMELRADRGIINIGNRLMLFDRIRRHTNSGSKHLIRAALHRFMAFLYELGDLREDRPGNWRLEQCLRMMQERVMTKLTLDELSAQAGVEKSHLCRMFKREMGDSPKQYFNKLKIDVAREALEDSDASLAEIADRIGFADEFHLSRTFKRVVGCPPSVYRRQQR